MLGQSRLINKRPKLLSQPIKLMEDELVIFLLARSWAGRKEAYLG